MQVFRHLPATPSELLALAIGNFDGMHLGHQALLNKLCEHAKPKKLAPAVMTFEPHPREFFTPLNSPARLSNLREKLEYFQHTGIKKVFVCAFNKPFAAINAQDFLSTLREKLNANTILVGEDFKFGAKRAGTVDDFKTNSFDLIPMPSLDFNSERISSTRVRDALFSGNLV